MQYPSMLCKLVDQPFKNKGWIFEQKIDGMRIMAMKSGQRVKLLTRNRIDKSRQFPEIVKAIENLKPHQFILDGEITAYRKGISSFQAIQPRVGQTNAALIKELIKTNPVDYMVFDLLELEGKSLINQSLLERKKKLKTIVKGKIVYLPHITENGISLFKTAKRGKWEGIIGKEKNSKYLPGQRTRHWVKIKTRNQQEFVIGAYTLGQGKVKTTFGAILVGYYQNKKLKYAGKVGTGFTETERKDLKRKFQALTTKNPAFADFMPEKAAIWLKPHLVGEFAFAEWTQDNILRQPVYLGLRIDKPAKSVIKEN